MDPCGRRQFLRAAAAGCAGVAAATLTGCAGERRPRRAAPRAGATTTTEALDPAAWAALASSLTGRLVLPDDPAYATARLLYDPRFDDLRPAAVAYCASPADVQRCVAFATAHGVVPVPRCGGHSYAGYSGGPGLVIDVTPMHDVTVTPTPGAPAPARAQVGAGTLLVDLYAQLAQAGVLVPGGSCPSVGIAGLALGGGIGVLARRYGLTCDAVESLDIVTADATLRTCDAERDADLHWACRGGGGGNFGVVTSFTFEAHPIPELALFTVDFPWGAATDVLGAWMAWQQAGPDELWSNCQLSAGGGGFALRSAGVLVGPASALDGLVDALVRSAGAAPTYRFVGPEQYLHAMLVEAGCAQLDVSQCHLSTHDPPGVLGRAASVASSAYVSAPPGDGVQAFVAAVEDLGATYPSSGGGLVFDAYGGAVNRVRPADTAFVHRHAVCGIQATVASGVAPSAVAGARAWLGHVATSCQAYVDGQAYQNYIDPTLADWQRAYYGSNLERLVQVKAAVDPHDVFSFAQSVPVSLDARGRGA